MLQTQIRIGKQVSHNRGDWDDILDIPTVETKNKKGDLITNYVLTLVFNLDTKTVEVSPSELYEFDPEQSSERFFNIKIQGGNNKAIYTCAETRKLEQLRKTFFGAPDKKSGTDPEKGQFVEAIDKDYPALKETPLYETLSEIFQLRSDFEGRFTSVKKDELLVDDKKLLESLSLKVNDRVVLVATSVIWSAKGWEAPVLFRDIDGYQYFLKQKFSRDSSDEEKNSDERLCYATGEVAKNVGIFKRTIRAAATITDMFVTETKNCSSSLGMNDASFEKSYQVGAETQLQLERGAKYLLENYRTRIAGIKHCIIPQLFSRDTEIDIETTLTRLKSQSDLLFDFKSFQRLAGDLEEDVKFPYWITFLAFESGKGEFFKTVNVIKDVSRTHLEALIIMFRQTHLLFKDLLGVDWESVMWGGEDRGETTFNLYTVYGLIPVRKDKEKKNEALILFKQILEKRQVDREKLFVFFKELILCHRFERYRGYANIYPNTVFDFAIRNAVFQYLALIQVLNQFNLLTAMEDNTQSTVEEVVPIEQLPDYQQHIETFFSRMAYTDAQKAMFYLGRALNVIAYKQYQKGYETKPVLNKLNYNGMDKDDIVRLRKDLGEKTQQFCLHRQTEHSFGRFTNLFNYNNWPLKPEETLFFILSGYSFYEPATKKDSKNA